MPIFAVRCIGRKEKYLLDAIESSVKTKMLPVKTAFFIPEIKGYVFVEADNVDVVKDAVSGVIFARGVLDKPINIDEVSHFFEEGKELVLLEVGDTVEIIGGPFKRERAKIIQIDNAKREAKVELVDSSIPIPITIKLDLLRKERRG